MSDTESAVTLVDGTGAPRQQLAIINSTGSIAPEFALRADDAVVSTTNPLPEQEIVPPLTYAGNPSAAVGTTSGPLFGSGTYQRTVTIQTLPGSTNNVYLRPDGSSAQVGTGILVKAGGGSVTFGVHGLPMPTATVTAITDAGSAQTVLMYGG